MRGLPVRGLSAGLLLGLVLTAAPAMGGPGDGDRAEGDERQAEQGPSAEDAERRGLSLAALRRAAGRKPKLDLPDFKTVAGELAIKEGFYRIYYNKKKREVLEGFIEIPASQLKRPFLLATSFAGGTTFMGWQWSDALCYWKRQENKLLLIRKNTAYKVDKKAPIGDAVNRTYTDELLLSLAIKTRSPKGGYLVSLEDLFARGATTFFGRPAAGLDTSLAVYSKLKTFPKNTEVAITMPQRGGGPFVTLHYSMRMLENTGYRPRPADDRVGYFLTVAKDYADGPMDDGRFVRLINRWNIQKLDPKLKASPVKSPIVFYLEKSIPVEYRRYVAAGILEWNKAFEKLGYLDAVQVRQQTDDNEFKDFDPEDARYNFFRCITSGNAFAMGPSRANPETGEILDADIIFDDSMLSYSFMNWDTFVKEPKKTGLHLPGHLADLEELLFGRDTETRPDGLPLTTFDKSLLEALRERHDHDHAQGHVCFFGKRKMAELMLARVALRAKSGADLPLDFLGTAIMDTVMHEVGHTLGLRHNFAASSWRSLDEINGKDRPKAIVASVMDYLPVNITPPGSSQGRFHTEALGPYDFWAIEYGYTAKSGAKDLAGIAARSGQPGLRYATDEDTRGPDPYVNRWDIGDNPLDYARQQVALAQKLVEDIEARTMEDGESWRGLRRGFNSVLGQYYGAAGVAGRFIGGVRISRSHRGDKGADDPVKPVDAKTQRDALKFLHEDILGAGNYSFSPALLRKLGSNNWSHWGMQGGASSYPIHDRLANLMERTLKSITRPDVIGRMLDNEMATDADKDVLTVPELFSSTTASITSELDMKLKAKASARKPAIAAYRRHAQRVWVERMIEMILDKGGFPPVAQSLAEAELRQLKSRLDGFENDNLTNLDPYSRAHVAQLRIRIERALEAHYQIGASGGAGGGGGIIIMLGKDGKPRRVQPSGR